MSKFITYSNIDMKKIFSIYIYYSFL